jgi:hypothetical protein
MNDHQNTQSENWQAFEELTAKIQQQLAPNARVEKNAKLLGKRSGIERQIDVLVEHTVLVLHFKSVSSPESSL